jgi:hypothetical protein
VGERIGEPILQARNAASESGSRNSLGFATLSTNGASVKKGCAMRLTILALLLSTGTAASCQSAPPAPANQQQPWLTPPGIPQAGRDFTKPPSDWRIRSVVPRKMEILPGPWPLHRFDDAQIDAQIIVHPPPSSLGEQSPGALLAQNLYPGLQLLPIDGSKAKGELIPTTWPNLKIEQIPIVWPRLEFNPVQKSPNGPAPEKK